MVVVGRINPRGTATTLSVSTYYSYTFWLFLVILLYAAFDADRIVPSLRIRRFFLGLVVLCGLANAAACS